MRKHFLILMLLALLPLSTWAIELTEDVWRVSVSDITYGDATPVPVVKWATNNEAVATTDYEVKYYKDAECTQEITIARDASTGNITTKLDAAEKVYVKIIALPASTYEGAITKSFKVSQRELTYTLDEGTGTNQINFTATYKQENFTKTFTLANVKITGAQNSETASDFFELASTGGTWNYEGTDANVKADGTTPLTTGDKGYEVTLTGLTLKDNVSKNYTISQVKNYVKIKPAAITITTAPSTYSNPYFTASSNYTTAYPYNGKEQKPAWEITYKYGSANGAVETLKEGTDFTVSYEDVPTSGTGNAVTKTWFVGTFKGSVATVTNTNYVLSTEASANAVLGQFEIAKSATKLPIIVAPKNNKKYDGVAYNLADAEFIIGQLADGDRGLSVTGLTAVMATAPAGSSVTYPTELAATAQTYYVKAKVDDNVKIKKEGSDWKLSDLYDIATPDAEWTIEKGDITITVTATPLTFGQKISQSTTEITVTGAAKYTASGATEETDENTSIKAYYEAAINTAYAPAASNTPYSSWTEDTKPTQGSYPDAITAKFTSSATSSHPLLDNYNEPTIVNATLVVGGAPFIIQPMITNVEYGTPVAPSYTAYSSDFSAATVTGTPKYVYKVLGASDDTYTEKVPTDIGTYTVKVSEGLTGTGNYLNGTPTFAEQDFQITKKTLHFTISPVTLHNGDTKTTLNKYAKVEYAEGGGAVNKETVALEFSFKAGVNDNETTSGTPTTLTVGNEAADYAITGTEGKSYNAIEVALTNGGDNDHYQLPASGTYTLGKLTIAVGRVLYIDGKADVNKKIEDAAIACADPALATSGNNLTYTVKFGKRELKADDWNVVVLPFNITPYEFTQAIDGYAIFNTLKSANTSNNTVKFGLELANLPANEPFLVKPLKAVKFETETTSGTGASATTTTTNIEFTGRTIKYDKIPQKTDVDGVKFIGTYVDTNVLVAGDDATEAWGYVNDGGDAGKKIMFLGYPKNGGKGQFVTATNEDGTQSYNILPLTFTKAYFDFNKTSLNAPSIIVEEADGSTTAISGITADGVAVKAEGWYTIDGMKLNAAPTQKGVYINNGKKIVVK